MQRINHTAPLPKANQTTRRRATPRIVTRRQLTYREHHVIVPVPLPHVPKFQWLSFIGKGLYGIMYVLMAMALYNELLFPYITPHFRFEVTGMTLAFLFFTFIFNPLSKRISEHRSDVHRSDVHRHQLAQRHYVGMLLTTATRGGRNNLANMMLQPRYHRPTSPPAPHPPPRPRNVMDM